MFGVTGRIFPICHWDVASFEGRPEGVFVALDSGSYGLVLDTSSQKIDFIGRMLSVRMTWPTHRSGTLIKWASMRVACGRLNIAVWEILFCQDNHVTLCTRWRWNK